MSSQTVTGRVVVDGGDGAPGTLTIETDEVDATSMVPAYGPDREWTYTDLDGHFHAWSGETLPTLERFTFVIGIDDEGGPITDRTYRCRACAEDIEPARVVVREAFEPATVPGLSSWSVVAHLPPRTMLSFTEKSSVRFMHLAGERFGFARATTVADDDWGTSVTLVGDGPLGTR